MNMTADDYRNALDKLGISQIAAGKMLRVGARTSRRWALGEAKVPPSVAMLLELLTKKRLKLEAEDLQNDEKRIYFLQAEVSKRDMVR
jgi:hypothetical protein